jgi:hypothetical protein
MKDKSVKAKEGEKQKFKGEGKKIKVTLYE